MLPITGRKEERELLLKQMESAESQFIAIYGRRRVGKTYLIRQVYGDHIVFQVTGLANAGTLQQLLNFFTVLKEADAAIASQHIPATWFEAFQMLKNHLEKQKDGKKVVFFDELPWIDTPKSNFISGLEHFWNSWASARNDIILVVCGSAASWMINKLIKNTGGLHNRVTQRIRLQPFTLNETEAFLKSRNINFDRYQIIELYMAMGGIPFYLDKIREGRSVFQEIDRLAFNPDGLLNTEFENLYHSLFKSAEKHIEVIEILSKKSKGLTREEIVKQLSLTDGGTLTGILKELEESGFIAKTYPFEKKIRDSLYRLTDQYSLFYFKFIKDHKSAGEGSWLSRVDSPSWRAWSGYAYENICQLHIKEIRKALGISGVYTELSSWIDRKRSVQVDLVLDRRDRIVNLCEVKFSQSEFVITKSYEEELRKKISVFKDEMKARKSVFFTMITTYGLKPNTYTTGFVQNVITMNDLF